MTAPELPAEKADDPSAVALRLGKLLQEAGAEPVDAIQAASFCEYLHLMLRWNSRTNLTAIRDSKGILARHFVECIACARILPASISSLLDFGSGAGLPGIPISICRPEITVILAESQGKKAAFLQEAVRVLNLSAQVHAGRAEDLADKFDCVVLRAVDRMSQAVKTASELVRSGGFLALMTTQADLPTLEAATNEGFAWRETVPLPGSEHRLLALGVRLN